MIKIIWGLALFFLFLFFLFFFILIGSRIYKNIHRNRRKKIQQQLSEPISEYLFDDNFQEIFSYNSYRPIQNFFGKKFKNNRFCRAVLRKEIIRLHRSYSGEIKDKLEHLFLVFGFDKEVGKKLRSSVWNIKANAICDAAQMNLTHQATYIFNLINYPNPIVRTEARVASIRLNKKNPFSFFNNIRYNLSEWDEIRILDALMEYQIAEIPTMGKWLDSKNESVVVFSLKIIGFYVQETETEKVIQCLGSTSQNIKLEAIKTLGELGSKESLASLFNCLEKEKENKNIALQTLQSLRQIGIYVSDVPKILPYLHKNQQDYDILFTACRVIMTTHNGIGILQTLTVDAAVSQIIKYALSDTI